MRLTGEARRSLAISRSDRSRSRNAGLYTVNVIQCYAPVLVALQLLGEEMR